VAAVKSKTNKGYTEVEGGALKQRKMFLKFIHAAPQKKRAASSHVGSVSVSARAGGAKPSKPDAEGCCSYPNSFSCAPIQWFSRHSIPMPLLAPSMGGSEHLSQGLFVVGWRGGKVLHLS
jgi:hypothetical protein